MSRVLNSSCFFRNLQAAASALERWSPGDSAALSSGRSTEATVTAATAATAAALEAREGLRDSPLGPLG